MFVQSEMHLVDVPNLSPFSFRFDGVVAELAREVGDGVFGVLARVLLLNLKTLSTDPQFFVDLAQVVTSEPLARILCLICRGALCERHRSLLAQPRPC